MSEQGPLARVLARVEKPGRYVGGEWNEIRKDPARVRTKVALAFPDVYEIGMSYLGQKILYALLNRDRSVLAERVFAPWPDFERELRAAGIPLASLENGIPLRDFDIVGFSLLYELNYSNVLTMLDLGGIPLTSAERGEGDPWVIAGGPAAFNPEPVADIFDLVFLGDGEEGFPEIVAAVSGLRERRVPRRDALRELARIDGVYVPSLYRVEAGGGFAARRPPAPPGRAGDGPQAARQGFLPLVLSGEDRRPQPARRLRPRGRRSRPRLSPELPLLPGLEPLFPASSQGPRLRPPDGPPEPPPDGLRGRLALGPLRRRPSRAREDRPRSHGRPGPGEDLPVALVAPARAAVARPRGEHPQGPQDRLHPRPRSGDRAPPGRDRQEARRPGDPGRPDLRLRGRLEARQALLHGRPPDGDGRGPGRDRRPRPLEPRARPVHPRLRPAHPRQRVLLHPQAAHALPVAGHGRRGRPRGETGLRPVRAPPLPERRVQDPPAGHVRPRGRLLARRPAARPGPRRRLEEGSPVRRLGRQARHRGLEGRLRGRRDRSPGLPQAPSSRRAAPVGPHRDRPQEEPPRPGARRRPSAASGRRAVSNAPAANARAARPGPGRRGPARRRSAPLPLPAGPAGEPGDGILRYRAVYSKRGKARYLSHIDLIHVIQRAFRRAGIEVRKTQGFHPKMDFSYGPALPLGMEARREVLEFRSGRRIEAAEFLRRINRSLPPGVRFSSLEPLPAGAPSLANAIERLVYSVDWKSADAGPARTAAGLRAALGTLQGRRRPAPRPRTSLCAAGASS